jgi:predicted enzyme related to lactoylglutathione lyase
MPARSWPGCDQNLRCQIGTSRPRAVAGGRAAFAYYGGLFGWKKLRDFDMGAQGQYLIYGLGESELGGMFTRAQDAPMPTTWFYYVVVEDSRRRSGACGRAAAS